MYLLNTLGFRRTCSGGAYAYVPETISQEVLRIDTEPQPGQYLVEDKWAKIASKDPIKVHHPNVYDSQAMKVRDYGLNDRGRFGVLPKTSPLSNSTSWEGRLNKNFLKVRGARGRYYGAASHV